MTKTAKTKTPAPKKATPPPAKPAQAEYTFHPIADEYPLMEDAELQALADDIKENGQQQPIITYKGQILDGRNRYRACQLADIPCRPQEYLGSEESIRAFIVSVNEHRRHLTLEWRQGRRQARIERIAQARRAGESLRTIAERERVSLRQVQLDIDAAAGVYPYTPEPESGTITGRDGKSYPARPTLQPRSACDNADDAEPDDTQAEPSSARQVEPTPASRPVDGAGLPIPDELLATFASNEKFDECLSLLRRAHSLLDDIAKGPGGDQLRYYGRLQTVTSQSQTSEFRYVCNDIKNTMRDLNWNRPFVCICPESKCLDEPQATCKTCFGKGWTTEHIWKNVEPDVKEVAEAIRNGKA